MCSRKGLIYIYIYIREYYNKDKIYLIMIINYYYNSSNFPRASKSDHKYVANAVHWCKYVTDAVHKS